MNIFTEKPNVVHVILSDNTGQSERFIVGKSLDEATSIIDPTPAWVKPAKRKRRTKAEIKADSKAEEPAEAAPAEDVPPPHASDAAQRRRISEDVPARKTWA